MNFNEAIKICLRNGVKVYPVYKNGKWYIETMILDKKKIIDKPIQNKEIDNAVKKTYIHLAKKL